MKPANSTRRPETRTIIEEKNKHNTAKNLKGLMRKSFLNTYSKVQKYLQCSSTRKSRQPRSTTFLFKSDLRQSDSLRPSSDFRQTDSFPNQSVSTCKIHKSNWRKKISVRWKMCDSPIVQTVQFVKIHKDRGPRRQKSRIHMQQGRHQWQGCQQQEGRQKQHASNSRDAANNRDTSNNRNASNSRDATNRRDTSNNTYRRQYQSASNSIGMPPAAGRQ